ncbi:hypothetical protein FIBSPDRAFT_900563 [Athelia psychrophila]|uniref:Uncharacterized protein n=1 Tax=Athelia psychrophila TaxID=1759441 RepID=A0A165Y9A3_9AGAM|nr:hypothetical protein FIBSPDRAFT_900563 [Fibularhizoctonia sp. CBS 109695]
MRGKLVARMRSMVPGSRGGEVTWRYGSGRHSSGRLFRQRSRNSVEASLYEEPFPVLTAATWSRHGVVSVTHKPCGPQLVVARMNPFVRDIRLACVLSVRELVMRKFLPSTLPRLLTLNTEHAPRAVISLPSLPTISLKPATLKRVPLRQALFRRLPLKDVFALQQLVAPVTI